MHVYYRKNELKCENYLLTCLLATSQFFPRRNAHRHKRGLRDYFKILTLVLKIFEKIKRENNLATPPSLNMHNKND